MFSLLCLLWHISIIYYFPYSLFYLFLHQIILYSYFSTFVVIFLFYFHNILLLVLTIFLLIINIFIIHILYMISTMQINGGFFRLAEASNYLKKRKYAGGNRKSWFTGMAAINATGEKLPMFFIGKSQLPKYFKTCHHCTLDKFDGIQIIWSVGLGAW